MASSPITSWEIDGEIVETVTGFTIIYVRIGKRRDALLKTEVCTEGTHDLGRRNCFLAYSPTEN